MNKILWKNSEIINGLRAAHRQVRIYHQRDKREVWVSASSTCKVLEEQVSPKGGTTIVEIRYPDGTFKSGMAVCRSDEAYHKKLGVSIALERALSNKSIQLNGWYKRLAVAPCNIDDELPF